MRVVLQRVSQASVSIEGQEIASIDTGYLLLVGIKDGDSEKEAQYLAQKISKLRVFEDDFAKMNLSIKEVGGSILSVSQFTLLANTKKGNRPSFVKAAAPSEGQRLYNAFNQALIQEELNVETGRFGAHMEIKLLNDGPVTIILDTDE